MDEKPANGAVQVVGMEMTESVEGGQKWSRPSTPVTPRSVTPSSPPQNIYLEGSLPSQSHLLVSQSEIEKLSQDSDESPVILSGKVTLSLIGLDEVRLETYFVSHTINNILRILLEILFCLTFLPWALKTNMDWLGFCVVILIYFQTFCVT